MDMSLKCLERSARYIRRSGSGKGGGRNITAFTRLKMAVLAPIPRPSVRTATTVKPGFFSNWRNANRRSFITQSHHRIDFGGPSRRDVGRQESDRAKQNRNNDE